MKSMGKVIFILACLGAFFCLSVLGPSKVLAVNAAFDFKKMGDMSDFDPNNPVIPTGDTIKIAVVATFSGPAALVGQGFWLMPPGLPTKSTRRAASWLTAKRS